MPRSGLVAGVACGAAAFALAASPAAAQPSRERFAARLELGAGSMLSSFQRNDDPGAFGGEAKGFGLALHGAVRLAWSPVDALSLQASLSNWVFPASGGREAGWVFAPMVGARFEPAVGAAGRAFVDGNVGLAMTGDLRTVQLDVGLGFEFALSPTVALGPVLRYGQTVQPDTRDGGQAEPYPDDARYLVGGLSLSLHTATAAAAAPTDEDDGDRDGDGVRDRDDLCPAVSAGAHADATRRGCPLVDTDGDGVSDALDLCVDQAPGEHPDAYRRGCPERDRDRDGVSDERDVCVEVPQGGSPDPMRPGCPAPDTDGDGVVDPDDRCPEAAMGTLPDPTRRGCPDGDRDGDGYVDSVDHCPDEAETFNNITDDDGCPEAERPMVEIRSGMIELQGNPVNFITGSDRIVGRRSFEILDALTAVLRAHAEITRVDIQGHTDDRGSRASNLDLSERRARAVRTYLIDHGILPDRVEAHGLGPDRPVADNRTPEGRSTNRRVEVHIVSVLPGAATRPR